MGQALTAASPDRVDGAGAGCAPPLAPPAAGPARSAAVDGGIHRDEVRSEQLVAGPQGAADEVSAPSLLSRAPYRAKAGGVKIVVDGPIHPLFDGIDRGRAPGPTPPGAPEANASRTTLPKVSVREGNTKQSALAKWAASSFPKR